MRDVDVVVIGSGAGGMAAALCLAQAGQRVLVCEQHYVPGGWCHSFTLGGYQFSPGVHYIGELGDDGRMRKIYEGLGVANDMAFYELNPDGYDHVLVAGRRFDYPKGKEALGERLKQRFPHARRGIDGYLDDVAALDDQLKHLLRIRGPLDLALLPARARTVVRHGLTSLARLFDHHDLRDPALRTILAAQGGDHGLPPSRASAALHAGVQAHYFNGGYYPQGGGFTIPRAFLRGLKRAGGELLLRTRVEKILIEGRGRRRRAVGVRLGDGTDVRAETVISNADPRVTFGLVGHEHLSRRLRWKLGRTTWSVSVLSLFLAVDMDLRAAGLDSGNYWYSRGADPEAHYRQARTADALDRELEGIFLTATSLKDPGKARDGHHTLEAFCLIPYDAFQRWAGTSHAGRPREYEALKARLTERILDAVEKVVPGLREHVVFSALGTPLTNEFYVNTTRGSIYGTEKTLLQLGPLGYGLKTEVPGLFMCGASTLSHGVVGATMSGIACARRILGCRAAELLTAEGQTLRVYSAEDAETWPQATQERAKAAPRVPA